jgi:hypothetical protein
MRQAMRFTTSDEMEYLSSKSNFDDDPALVEELSRRLDALRRFDQHYVNNDWQPQRTLRNEQPGCKWSPL